VHLRAVFLCDFIAANRNKIVSLAVQAILFVMPALAESGEHGAHAKVLQMNLQQAVRQALQKNRLLLAENAGLDSTAASFRQAAGHLMPRISIASDVSRSNSPMSSFGSKLLQQRFTAADLAVSRLNNPAYVSNFRHRVILEAPIYQGGKLWAARARAGHALEASRQQLAVTRQQVMFSVLQTYINIYRLKSRGKAAQSALAAAQSHLAQTRAFLARGISIKSDILDAQAYVSETALALTQTHHARLRAVDELRRLLNVESADIKLTGVPGVALRGVSEAHQDVEHHPRLVLLARQLDAARAAISEASAGLLPHVGFVATQEWDNHTITPKHPNNTIAAEVSMNLFAGGADVAARDTAQARFLRLQYRLQDERQRLQNELADAWRQLHEAQEAAKARHDTLKQAGESLRIQQLRFSQGLEKTSDLLDAQTRADTAAANDIDAHYNLIVRRAAVLLAAGRLAPEVVQ